MKKKTETKKKSKQGNDIEYETVERHIKVEEAVSLCFMFMFDVSSKSTDNKVKQK
jgi:hypothetical protein